MTTSPRSNPQKSPSFQIFFPRSHFSPCRGIRNGLWFHDLTPLNLIFLKKPVLPLILLSATLKNPYFGQTGSVSSGWKFCTSRPFQRDADSQVVISDPQSGQFDPQKWSVWGKNWLWKFENLLRKFENRLWNGRKVSQKWRFSRGWWGWRSIKIEKWPLSEHQKRRFQSFSLYFREANLTENFSWKFKGI